MRLFATKPYEDVSVDEVCEQAGVAHGLVSYHFGGKRGLFAAAVQQAWDERIEFERPTIGEESTIARVRGFLHRHFEYAAVHPERFEILMRTGHADPEVLEIARAAQARAMAELTASLGCRDHLVGALRASMFAWAGFVEHITLDWLANKDLDVDMVTDLCVQALVGAVRSANGFRYDAEDELGALDQVADARPRIPRGATATTLTAATRAAANRRRPSRRPKAREGVDDPQ